MLLRDSRDSRDSFMLDHLNLSVWYQGPQLDAPSLDIAVRLVMAITDNLQQDMAIWPGQCLDCIVLILCISMLLFDYFDSCFGLFDCLPCLACFSLPLIFVGKERAENSGAAAAAGSKLNILMPTSEQVLVVLVGLWHLLLYFYISRLTMVYK